MEKLLALKTINNIGYNSFANIAAMMLRFFANIILAQHLVSQDYGVVSFAMVMIGFVAQFNDLGISSAVIQKSQLDDKSLNTAFILKLFIGGLLFIICAIIAPKSVLLFDHPQIGAVIQILAINFIISAFYFMPQSILSRDLEYKILSVANIISAGARSIISIILVFLGFRYWSLIWAELGATLSLLLILNYLRPIKIRSKFDLKDARHFISFGGKLFLTGIIIFLIKNADNFIIGAIGGASVLGFYALAFNWGSMICDIFEGGIHKVLFSTYSRIQNDIELMKRIYLKVLEYASMIGVMVNIILLINAKDFLFFVLGRGTDKWLPAILPLQILCIYGISRVILVPVGNIVVSLGHAGVLLKANLLAAILEIALLYPAMKYFGMIGVSILIVGAYTIQYIIFVKYLRIYLNISMSGYFRVIRTPMLCGLITFAVGQNLNDLFVFNIVSMLLKGLICSSIYIITYGIITKWKMLMDFRKICIDLQL